jgi:hypothetical protein
VEMWYVAEFPHVKNVNTYVLLSRKCSNVQYNYY